jgi:uncharacterized protein YbbC (DUF1343 family)
MNRTAMLPLVLCFASSAFAANVRFGIDVLEDDNFKQLAGKRVGLVANPAAVDAQLRATSDVLAGAAQVKLVSLFGPEHGIYGDEYAGAKVEDRKDPRTGRTLYSLYGKANRPTTRMVQDIDAIVFDLQDIGSRSYTYIATMKNCMESCVEHDREFIVLDRPNPLGGMRVEGPALVKGYESGVSSLPVPYVHGMTMGELAQLTRDKFFPKFQKLTVIKMRGWTRDMVWSDTGHEWVPTSPHVPTARSAAAYAATGILGELYVINIGVGYTLPFEMVGSPWIDGEALANAIPKQNGVIFRPVHFRPFYSTFQGEPCEGVQVHIDPKNAQSLVNINYQLLDLLGAERLFKEGDAKAKKQAEDAAAEKAKKAAATQPARATTRRSRTTTRATTQPVKWDPRTRMFDKVSGTDEPRTWLMQGKKLDELFAKWKKECEQFREDRKKYLLY